MTIEELKALEAGLHGNDFAEGDIQTALDALPALLAVAEAAKELQRVWYKNNHVVNSELDLKVVELLLKLAALETKEPKR